MNAPQIIYLVFTAIGLITAAVMDNTETTITYSFAIHVVKRAIVIAILFWGGFFGGG